MQHIYDRFDEISYQLGIIDCFCEMVASRVKRLALSHPLTPLQHQQLGRASDAIATRYGVKCYLERDFIITNLAPEAAMVGKWVILFYTDEQTLAAYDALKAKSQTLMVQHSYGDKEKQQITIELCRLLGYPEHGIVERFPSPE